MAWKLHKFDIDSDFTVARKMEGAGGRIDYHIVARVPHDARVAHYDLGHVYHTTHWRQNTYPPTGPLLPCTRALVVSGDDTLLEALRSAVAKSWLALSRHEHGRIFILLSRNQKHPDEICDGPSAAETFASTSRYDWKSPDMTQTAVSNAIMEAVQNISRQCKLVCPNACGKEEKHRMLRRLFRVWRPENARLLKRDAMVCQKVIEWLGKLRQVTSL